MALFSSRSSIRLLICTSCDVISLLLYFSGWISMKLATNIQHVSGIPLKRFSQSEVKVIRVQMCVCYNGGGEHFDGVDITSFIICQKSVVSLNKYDVFLHSLRRF